MLHIENETLKVAVRAAGAELDSIYHKEHRLEYLWQADPAFWAKKSPVLFPIVGTLKGGRYFFRGSTYEMGRHGFARDRTFACEQQDGQTIRCELQSDEGTRRQYPLDFTFAIIYRIEDDRLDVTYEVQHPTGAELYFSVGGHPAFRVPLVDGLNYSDYYLEFEQEESAGRWPIDGDGLIMETPVPMPELRSTLPLDKSLFYRDALVLKRLNSSKVTLRSNVSPRGLHFSFPGFPYLGIWAARDANFVCIEPWCGIADSVGSDQQLEHKEGIIHLPGGQVFRRTWSATFF